MKKMYNFQHVLLIFIACYYVDDWENSFTCSAKKIQIMSTEHPSVTYWNPRYVRFVNMTSQRYFRRNPVYQVGIHIETLIPVNYNLSIDFYFYEFLTNVYKRSFVEMHFELCNMVHHDKFFGAPLKQGKLAKPCPWPPGIYHLTNMSIDIRAMPRNFPFRKGRIYSNLTSMDTKDTFAAGFIDLELKEVNIKNYS